VAAVFDASFSPFDRLNPDELEALQSVCDVGYYPPGATILTAGEPCTLLYVVIKGHVEEREGEDAFSLLGPRDVFDSRAIMQGTSTRSFVTTEETLVYQIERAMVRKVIAQNERFGAFFYLDVSKKIREMAHDEEESRFGSLMRARVSDLFLHPADFIDATESIEAAGRKMREIDSNALFVRDGDRVGVVTGMNLSKAAVLKRMPITDPVGPISHFNVVTISPEDFVSTALILMTKHNKRRLAVKQGDEFVGVLEDIDVLSFIAGNSQVVAGRIDRASSPGDLCVAANAIEGQVRRLRRQGVKAEMIAEIVSDLNRRLFARTFEFTAAPELREKSCLIVMGSEGRGEQTMRTDQDNGLLLDGSVDQGQLQSFREEFFEALASYGFPPCPGAVMVINPFWSRPVSDFIADFRQWVSMPTQESHMNVAIFYDAVAVAGRSELLDEAKRALIEMVSGERAYLGHFAKSIDAFPTPIGFFRNLIARDGAEQDSLDLKKGGIFPIVHGVRAIGLEHGLMETSTVERLAKIGEMNILKPEFARELTQAFQYLTALRLDAQLSAEAGKGALMRPSELSTMDRDLLRDAFAVVKQFREIIRRHFNLQMFG
jgi:CBS domain-containing protein